MKRAFLAFALMCFVAPALATTYYVDPVNGNINRYDAVKNPTGVANGTGTAACVGTTPNQNCPFGDVESAWNIIGVFADSQWVMGSGDILRIKNCGPTTGIPCKIAGDNSAATSAVHCWGIGVTCAPPDLPSNVTIEGDNVGSCSTTITAYNASGPLYQYQGGDSTKQAWITAGNGAFFTLSITATTGSTVSCVHMSDQSACGVNATPAPGGSSPGCGGTQASFGIYTGNTVPATNANIALTDVTIEGYQSKGLEGNLGGTWTLTRVGIGFNGQTGWDNDPGSHEISSGSIVAQSLAIYWNGCGQQLFPYTTAIPVSSPSCAGQSNGGQGDGMGTPVTVLNFSCNQCAIFNNIQDGIDWGHTYGGTLSFTNSFFYGNGGGNIKVGPNSNVTVYNNIINSGCNRFGAAMTGTPTGYGGNMTDNCRANTMNGINALGNSVFLNNAAANGTANVTCSGTTCTSSNGFSGLSNGQHVMSNVGSLAADDRIVSAVSSPTFTISAPFANPPSGFDVITVLAPTPSSSSVIKVYHNTFIGYASSVFDNQCQLVNATASPPTQGANDPATCAGVVWDFRNNVIAGYSNPNWDSGTPPILFSEMGATIEDYNLCYNLTGGCTGAHDITTSPLFTSQPATPMTGESDLDSFNFNLSSGSPAKAAGVVISGQTTDYFGNAWDASTPSMGAIQFGGTPPSTPGVKMSGTVFLKGNAKL